MWFGPCDRTAVSDPPHRTAAAIMAATIIFIPPPRGRGLKRRPRCKSFVRRIIDRQASGARPVWSFFDVADAALDAAAGHGPVQATGSLRQPRGLTGRDGYAMLRAE